jgi:hypothetical protein
VVVKEALGALARRESQSGGQEKEQNAPNAQNLYHSQTPPRPQTRPNLHSSRSLQNLQNLQNPAPIRGAESGIERPDVKYHESGFDRTEATEHKITYETWDVKGHVPLKLEDLGYSAEPLFAEVEKDSGADDASWQALVGRHVAAAELVRREEALQQWARLLSEEARRRETIAAVSLILVTSPFIRLSNSISIPVSVSVSGSVFVSVRNSVCVFGFVRVISFAFDVVLIRGHVSLKGIKRQCLAALFPLQLSSGARRMCWLLFLAGYENMNEGLLRGNSLQEASKRPGSRKIALQT